ncbi:putative SMC domain-containing protein [Salmonella phage SPFM8]|nr:putative SMC domain-containing protein [Salmonella phage SPFM8]
MLKEHHHARLIINAVSARERFRQMEGAIARLAELENNVVVRELLNRREAKLDAYTSIERFQKGYEHLVSEMNISVNRRQANELERETTQLQQTKEGQKIEHIRSQLDGANRRLIESAEREWQEAVAAVGNVDGALTFTEELDSAMMYLRQSAKLAKLQELDIFTTSRDRYGAIARAIREIVMSYSNHPVVGLFFRKMDSLLRDRKEIEEDVRSLRIPEIEKAINDNEGWKKQLKDAAEVDCPQCNHRFRPGIRKSLQRCENVLHGLYHDRQHFLERALEKRLQGMDLTSAGLSEKRNWNLPLSMHLDQLKTTDRLALFEGTRIDVDSIQNALNDA